MPAQRLPQVLVVEEGRGRDVPQEQVLRRPSRDIHDVREACDELASDDELLGRDERRGLQGLRDRDSCPLRVCRDDSDCHVGYMTLYVHCRDCC